MAVSPSRDRMFRQALARRSGGDKKGIDRGLSFRTRSLYPLFFLWGVFVGVSAYLLFVSPLLDITEISISGENRLSGMRLGDTVETALVGKRFHLFTKRNYFLLPAEEIRESLRETYPLIQSVAVRRVFPRRLEVSITERPSLWVWCSGGPCYLVSEDGWAESNDRALFEAYTPWRLSITDTSALPVHTDELFEAREYFQHLESFVAAFPEQLEVPLKREASTASRYSQELRLTTEEGWTVLASTEIPVEETLSALRVFLENRKATPSDAQLAVVDARVPGKIFYAELNRATGTTTEPQEATPVNDSSERSKPKKKKEARD